MSRTLIKDSTIYGLGTLLTRSARLLLLPIYTRYLSVAEYGALSLLNLILEIITYFCLLGVGMAATRFYFEKDATDAYQRQVYGNATFLMLVLPIVVVAVAGPAVWWLAGRYLASIAFFPYIAVILAIGLLTPLIKLLSGLLRVQRRPYTFIGFNLGFFLVQTAAIVAALVWLEAGLAGQVYSQLLANVLFAVAALVILVRYSRPQLNAPLAWRMLAFGIPLIPFFIFTWMESAAGRFALEQFVDLKQVGIFALAAQFAGLMALWATALDNALLPHFLDRARDDQAGAELGLLTSRYVALFGLMGLVIIVFAKPTIIIMAAADYHEAARYVAPLALSTWLFVANKPVSWSLTQGRRTGLLSTLHGGSMLLLVIGLLLFLGPMGLGIMGVIYATIAANLFALVAGYLISRQGFRMQMPWGKLLAMVSVIVAGGVVLVLLEPAGIDLSRLLVQSALLACIVVATARLAGITNPWRLLRPSGR